MASRSVWPKYKEEIWESIHRSAVVGSRPVGFCPVLVKRLTIAPVYVYVVGERVGSEPSSQNDHVGGYEAIARLDPIWCDFWDVCIGQSHVFVMEGF